MAPRVATAADMRHIRTKLGLSQAAFARLLGVSPESYRPWDSGRRRPQREWMDKALLLLAVGDPSRTLSMVHLAEALGVHPRTLRDAARAGRLEFTYTNQVAFGHPVPVLLIRRQPIHAVPTQNAMH